MLQRTPARLNLLLKAHSSHISRAAAAKPHLNPTQWTPRSTPSFRSYATYYPPADEKKGMKLIHVFTFLTLIATTATSYGLYQFYNTFTTYPNTASHPIRQHLRSALRSVSTASYSRASSSFEKAYALALDLVASGSNALGNRSESLMKTTGIVIRWGGMWEDAGERMKAIECYEMGWREILPLMDDAQDGKTENLSQEDVLRGVAIALKIGDLYVDESKDDEAEKYYVWSVEEMMKLGMSDEQKSKVQAEVVHGIQPVDAKSLGMEEPDKETGMDLPKWGGKVELVAGFERLGELYARQGKLEYAQPLLQQAIATLLPPPPKDGTKGIPPPIPTRCHAATLMNNLSTAIVSTASPDKAAIESAARWARQALTVSNQCRKEADTARKGIEIPISEKVEAECEMVAIVGSYNLGKLSELSGDRTSAQTWFEKSRKNAARVGLRDGVTRSTEAIERLGIVR